MEPKGGKSVAVTTSFLVYIINSVVNMKIIFSVWDKVHQYLIKIIPKPSYITFARFENVIIFSGRDWNGKFGILDAEIKEIWKGNETPTCMEGLSQTHMMP